MIVLIANKFPEFQTTHSTLTFLCSFQLRDRNQNYQTTIPVGENPSYPTGWLRIMVSIHANFVFLDLVNSYDILLVAHRATYAF